MLENFLLRQFVKSDRSAGCKDVALLLDELRGCRRRLGVDLLSLLRYFPAYSKSNLRCTDYFVENIFDVAPGKARMAIMGFDGVSCEL